MQACTPPYGEGMQVVILVVLGCIAAAAFALLILILTGRRPPPSRPRKPKPSHTITTQHLSRHVDRPRPKSQVTQRRPPV